MNKSDLIDFVAGYTGLTKATSSLAVDAVIAGIESGVKQGGVSLVGFATFEQRHVPAGKARNPRTGESVDVPAKTKVVARVSKKFGV